MVIIIILSLRSSLSVIHVSLSPVFSLRHPLKHIENGGATYTENLDQNYHGNPFNHTHRKQKYSLTENVKDQGCLNKNRVESSHIALILCSLIDVPVCSTMYIE